MKTIITPSSGICTYVVPSMIITIVLLLIPFVLMRLTNEIQWELADYLVAGGLLFGAIMMLFVTLGSRHDIAAKMILSVTLLVVLGFIWAELAVGILG